MNFTGGIKREMVSVRPGKVNGEREGVILIDIKGFHLKAIFLEFLLQLI